VNGYDASLSIRCVDCIDCVDNEVCRSLLLDISNPRIGELFVLFRSNICIEPFCDIGENKEDEEEKSDDSIAVCPSIVVLAEVASAPLIIPLLDSNVCRLLESLDTLGFSVASDDVLLLLLVSEFFRFSPKSFMYLSITFLLFVFFSSSLQFVTK
jgi:hypothetical protein